MLEVMVSTDCGANWITVFSKSGTTLATWPNSVASAYIPVSAGEWRTEEVSLTGFNVPNLLVKFVATNDNGNNMFLDNINLSQSDPVGIHTYGMVNYLVDVFPNPSRHETQVLVNSVVSSEASLKLINAIGQVVLEQKQNLVQGENTLRFDVSAYSEGIYSLVIESVHGKVVKKLQISE